MCTIIIGNIIDLFCLFFKKKNSDEEVEEDAVASAAGNFQQLNLHEEEAQAQEENPAVIIPDHLQVSNADCAHLSFGSFSSGAFSGMFQQKALEAHLEVSPAVEEPSTVDQPDNRYIVLFLLKYCIFCCTRFA